MKYSGMVVTAAVMLFAAGEAQAFPASPAPLAPAMAGDIGSDLTLVRQGCGFGAHQGRFGGCRLNRGPRGQARRFFGGAPRGCRPGTHPIGRGICRRNGY